MNGVTIFKSPFYAANLNRKSFKICDRSSSSYYWPITIAAETGAHCVHCDASKDQRRLAPKNKPLLVDRADRASLKQILRQEIRDRIRAARRKQTCLFFKDEQQWSVSSQCLSHSFASSPSPFPSNLATCVMCMLSFPDFMTILKSTTARSFIPACILLAPSQLASFILPRL